MDFNKHWDQVGKHAFLGASQHAWLNYDREKLVEVYTNLQAKEKGTIIHAFAEQCIRLGQTLPKTKAHLTLNEYVNDAIGFGLTPEVVLYYSDNIFGTADAIGFKNNKLRIHDLKTGVSKPASMEQLYIYAALFCLEYKKEPEEIEIFLRIYQFNTFVEERPAPETIRSIMAKITVFDKILFDMQKGV